MNFKLSTLLVVLAILAVGFAFFFRPREDRVAISGEWYYPHEDIKLLGYQEKLTILKDGTFSKLQSHRTGSECYKGRWKTTRGGVVEFFLDEVKLEHRENAASLRPEKGRPP